jgi:1,4-alpha-glucan branching enzyme
MKKTYNNDRTQCRVTFELPAEVNAKTVAVCGDFNDWERTEHMLQKRKDGRFSTTLTLTPGTYHYRFWLDDNHWENDWEAEQYAPNEFGTEDSVITI